MGNGGFSSGGDKVSTGRRFIRYSVRALFWRATPPLR